MAKLPLIEFEYDNQKAIINLQGFKMAECKDVFHDMTSRNAAGVNKIGIKSVPMESWTSYQLYLSWKHNLIRYYFWKNDKAARDAVYEKIVVMLKEMKQ
jgi:hypothetical protein